MLDIIVILWFYVHTANIVAYKRIFVNIISIYRYDLPAGRTVCVFSLDLSGKTPMVEPFHAITACISLSYE